MNEFEILLFLHIATVICAFLLGGALHISEYQVRYATTMQELRLVTRPFKYGPLFAPLLVLLVLFGARLASLGDYDMSEAWLWTAVVAALVLLLDGPVVMAPHGKEMAKAFADAGDGPIPPAVRALACDAKTWIVGHANTALALSVVLNMVVKPDTLGAVAVLLVGTALGAAVGLRRSKIALLGVGAAKA